MDYKIVFQTLMLPGCIVDATGVVLAWNDAMHTFDQKDAAAALGHPLAEMGKMGNAVFTAWQQLRTPSPTRVNLRVNHRAYTLFCVPLPGGAWSLLIEDLQMILDHQHEQNDMLYAVLHDLQNPLAAIKGYVELASHAGTLNEKQEHYLSRVNLAIHDITDLAARLLEVAWLDADLALELKAVNFAHLVHNLASGFTEQARQQNVHLTLNLQPVPPVMCDERRIKQVINNLLSNAIKYSIQGGEVRVSVSDVDGQMQFEVSDQGIGIPEAYLAKIFERFVRVPGEPAEKVHGNGLGLAISYEIVEKHGARLYVESQVNQGSRFYFSLPLA